MLQRIISFTNNLHTVNHELSTYWLFYLIFLGLLFIPGYSLIHYISKRKKIFLNLNTKLIFAPIISIVVMFIFGMVFLLTKNKLVLSLFVPFSFLSFIYLLLSKAYQDIFKLGKYLLAILLAITIIFVSTARRDYVYGLNTKGLELDTTIPVPITGYTGYDADSITPWRVARFFYSTQSISSPYALEMLQNIVIYERTPLFPIITTVIINIFGESHFVYQRFLEILVALYYLGIYYLIKSFTSSTTKSNLIYGLLLINVQLSLMAYNVELYYKYFAALPIILATALLSKKPNNKLLSVQLLLLILSFMIHPYTIVLSIAFIATYLLKVGFKKKTMLTLVKWSLPFFVLIGMWYYSSKIITLPDEFNRTSSLYFQNSFNDKTNIIQAKVVNLAQLLVPNPYQTSVDPNVPLTFVQSRFQFLRYSLISNLTPVVFIFFIIRVFKSRNKDQELLYAGLFPLLVFWLVYLNRFNQKFDYGGTYFLLYQFSVPVLLTYVFTNLKSRFSLILSTISYVAWMIVVLLAIGDSSTTLATPGTIAYSLSSLQTILFILIGVVSIIVASSNKIKHSSATNSS